MTVNILGTDYAIEYRPYDGDRNFRDGADGYCKYCGSKLIAICNLATHPDYSDVADDERVAIQKMTLRHEIVHAFMVESGLPGTSSAAYRAWSDNEEMVEWIAYMGEKIHKAWSDAGAL